MVKKVVKSKKIKKIVKKPTAKVRISPVKKKKTASVKKVVRKQAAKVIKIVTKGKLTARKSTMSREEINPIIAPNKRNYWEAWQTFNPGVVSLDDKVHFVYRAIGTDGISRLGYAISNDGLTIDQRHDTPCYQHPDQNNPFNFYSYFSGGGWGGSEDPRLTFIEEDDRVYMPYVALDGLPQLAITSISKKDFLNKVWNWRKPQNISPPNTIVKSGVLFPEKINGKYAIMYRIFPDIWIDYVDSLDFKRGEYLKGEPVIKIRSDFWDSRKIGAGASPLRTKDGWLLIYYAVDEKDSGRYKMGAMLLDFKDPTKVLYRTENPIIEPDEWFENNGHKRGIVYPTGAVIKGGNLLVYYGGADSYVCVASAPLDEFLLELKQQKPIRFTAKKLSNNKK